MTEPALLDRALFASFPLPHHAEDADKEDRGRALIIAGSREIAGAALLAGTAALRAGAGKLQIATGASVAPGLGLVVPEARVMAFAEAEDGCIDPAAVEGLVGECRDVDALVVGPGMQHGAGLRHLVAAILASGADYPLVLDAAVLGDLAEMADAAKGWTGSLILLPHAGEMARLLECDAEDVTADPLAAVRAASERYRATVLVKGEWSFVCAADGRSFRYQGGGVGLATSGSGDTLAGIVGGIAARGADALTALLWGVYLHGEAGRILTERVGRLGFLAREIPDLVPGLMETEACNGYRPLESSHRSG